MKTYLVTVDDKGVETREEITAAIVPEKATLVVAPVGGYWDASTAAAVGAQLKAAGVKAVVFAAPVTTGAPA